MSDIYSHRVSVVVPAYNCDQFVAEAIESALSQTVPPHEVIVVDDGSTDGTAAVLRRFGNRIRVISQANRGLAGARNAGVAVATGTWLAFLDADDTWLPTKLARQLEVGADPRIAMVYTDRFNIGERGSLPRIQSEIQQMFTGDVFIDLLLLGNHITASSVMIRRDVVLRLGGFGGHCRGAEDWDLWIRVAESHQVGVCLEPLVCYRIHQGMMSADPRRMQVARNEVIRGALASPRGQSLPRRVQRRIVAAVARTNAWDASRRGVRALA